MSKNKRGKRKGEKEEQAAAAAAAAQQSTGSLQPLQPPPPMTPSSQQQLIQPLQAPQLSQLTQPTSSQQSPKPTREAEEEKPKTEGLLSSEDPDLNRNKDTKKQRKAAKAAKKAAKAAEAAEKATKAAEKAAKAAAETDAEIEHTRKELDKEAHKLGWFIGEPVISSWLDITQHYLNSLVAEKKRKLLGPKCRFIDAKAEILVIFAPDFRGVVHLSRRDNPVPEEILTSIIESRADEVKNAMEARPDTSEDPIDVRNFLKEALKWHYYSSARTRSISFPLDEVAINLAFGDDPSLDTGEERPQRSIPEDCQDLVLGLCVRLIEEPMAEFVRARPSEIPVLRLDSTKEFELSDNAWNRLSRRPYNHPTLKDSKIESLVYKGRTLRNFKAHKTLLTNGGLSKCVIHAISIIEAFLQMPGVTASNSVAILLCCIGIIGVWNTGSGDEKTASYNALCNFPYEDEEQRQQAALMIIEWRKIGKAVNGRFLMECLHALSRDRVIKVFSWTKSPTTLTSTSANKFSINIGPIDVTPLDVTPLSVTPLATTPLTATPLAATPLAATPLAATPLAATPLAATPLAATPFDVNPLDITPLENPSPSNNPPSKTLPKKRGHEEVGEEDANGDENGEREVKRLRTTDDV